MPSLGCSIPFGLTWIWKNSPKTARLKLKTDENSSAFSKRYDLGKDERGPLRHPASSARVPCAP